MLIVNYCNVSHKTIKKTKQNLFSQKIFTNNVNSMLNTAVDYNLLIIIY